MLIWEEDGRRAMWEGRVFSVLCLRSFPVWMPTNTVTVTWQGIKASFSPSSLAASSFVADWSFQPVLGSEHPFLCGANLVRAAGCSQTMEEWKLQRPPILIYVSQLVFSNPQQSFVWMIRGWGGQCATQGRGRPAVSCVSKLSWQIRVLPCVIATCILTEWLAKRYGQ